MNAMTNVGEPPVTFCKPGKRAGVNLRPPLVSAIPLVTQTALVAPAQPSIVPPARGDRRPAQERVEAALRAEAVSVVLAQPHRAGSDDAMLVEPLGVFCRRQWPPRLAEDGRDLNADHRNAMYRAGQHYAEAVHQHRVLLGLGSGGRTQAEGLSVTLSDAELRTKCEAARIKRDAADDVLRAIFSGAVSAMMRVCVDELDPTPYQEDVVRHSLWALGVHFGVVKPGVHKS